MDILVLYRPMCTFLIFFFKGFKKETIIKKIHSIMHLNLKQFAVRKR